jgi:hypothetical protein
MAKLSFIMENGHLAVTGANGTALLTSTDYYAKNIGDGEIIEVSSINNDSRAKTWRFPPEDATLNGNTYFTGDSGTFVEDFNAIAGMMLGYNTKYPENLFSQHIELDTSVDEQVVPLWVIAGHNGGYVTITAPSTNTGNIYVGEDDVSTDSYALEPDKSITLEISDLSLIWVQSTVAGDVVNVIGVAKT